jgi:AcrR family transcriptional regulator
VIERQGLDDLRLRDVAEEMRLTDNAIRYYYKTVEDLVAALAARSDPRFLDDRRQRIMGIESHAEKLAVLIRDGLPLGVEDTEWRVIWSAVLDAGFRLDLRSDVQGIYHRQVDLYAEVLREGKAAGAFELHGDPLDIARGLMSLEDNLGFRIAARDPEVTRDDAIRIMTTMAEAATGASIPRSN